MDAINILGKLLAKNALGSKTGGSILDTLLGGAPRGKAPSSMGNPADILGTLLGGKKGGKGGVAALLAILAVAAAANKKGKGGSGGGLVDLLGGLTGASEGKGGSGGGLGDLLGGLMGASGGKSSSGGGLGDLLGGLMGASGGKGGSGGGLGDLLGGLAGAAGGKGGSGGGLGDLLGGLMGAAGGGRSGIAADGLLSPSDSAEAEEGAELLIEAMCLAANSDGQVDEKEREAILGQLGDLDDEEIAFVKQKLASRVSVEDFARRVPKDQVEQVYAFALLAVRLDTEKEAEWFARLAQALRIDGGTANDIHARLGQPEIFA